MPPRRRIDSAEGRAALEAWWSGLNNETGTLPRSVVASAVRFTLEELAERAEGNTVEVRIPPFGATQCIEGPRHTRGTPPNVIETDPQTWLRLASGLLDWDTAVSSGKVHASGQRAHLDGELPLFTRPTTA